MLGESKSGVKRSWIPKSKKIHTENCDKFFEWQPRAIGQRISKGVMFRLGDLKKFLSDISLEMSMLIAEK